MQSIKSPEGSTAPSAVKVLIVEDEFLIADNLRDILEEAGYQVLGIAYTIANALVICEQDLPDIVLLDIYLKGTETSLALARSFQAQHIPFIYISSNANDGIQQEVKATQPYGYIGKPFGKKDVLYSLEIALHRHAHSLEKKLWKEKDLQLSLTNILSTTTPWEVKLRAVVSHLQPFIPFDLITFSLENGQSSRSCNFFRMGADEYQTILPADLLRMSGLSQEKYDQLRTQIPLAEGLFSFSGDDFIAHSQQFRLIQLIAKTFSLQSNLQFTISSSQRGLFSVSFYSRQPTIYQPDHLSLLARMQPSILLMLERLLAYEEITRLSEQLGRENRYLQEEVKTIANIEEVIGKSPLLLTVFNQVSQVAPTDATVLLTGESGTGKELFARTVHKLSTRKEKVLIKVNCATLPPGLIESELFGHEKGAFTGASEKRIGKFELAHQGTIFLDEIGEMPLELQAKLLRVLQEKEIERLGGKGPIKTDVRVIAATNRHLEKEVAQGRFRLDLYYRLSVFPILLPALRERVEDIPMLAYFFVQKFSRKMGKICQEISPSMIADLMSYSWPGNIRELENVIEQAVIVYDGKGALTLGRPLINTWISQNLNVDEPHLATTQFNPPADSDLQTQSAVKHHHDEKERDTILAVLKKTNGKIRGKGGAAELLNIKPNTLEYRMGKLGIKK